MYLGKRIAGRGMWKGSRYLFPCRPFSDTTKFVRFKRPVRLVVRTPGFRPGNRSSILLRATLISPVEDRRLPSIVVRVEIFRGPEDGLLG